MKLRLSLLVLLLVVAVLSVFADATTFTLSVLDVSAYGTLGSDDGLGIYWAPVAQPLSNITFNLMPGQSTSKFDLFYIWTKEGTVNDGEDTTPKEITVSFAFNPPQAEGGSVEGKTKGVLDLCLFGVCAVQYGKVTWGGPEIVDLGDGGYYTLTLFNETFNKGLFGLTPGECFGSTVEAKLTYNAAPTVPEPSSMILLGSGLLGGLGVLRRKLNR